MNTHPINLGVRFLLEMAMLTVLSMWGWKELPDFWRYAAAFFFPAIAAALWGIFRIPNDPKPALVPIPGILRLLMELFLFGLAVAGLLDMHYQTAGKVFTLLVLVHYLVSYDRTWAMLKNKSYRGFIDKTPRIF